MAEKSMADNSGSLRSAGSIRQERYQSLLERYGGFSWGADFLGFGVAIFFTEVLFGIVGAIVGTVGYQMGAPVPKIGSAVTGTTQNLGIGGLIGGLIALFLAYLLGGYAAGRMARFDGARNGIGVVIWTIIVAIILAIVGAVLGTKFNVANQIHLHVDRAALTAGGLISVAVALVVMVIGAVIGGIIGANSQRAIDRDAGVL